jgi:hypothetical protein
MVTYTLPLSNAGLFFSTNMPVGQSPSTMSYIAAVASKAQVGRDSTVETHASQKKMPQQKDFVSIRLDKELKEELLKASELERRSLSGFTRLLLEFAWAEYLKAGSMHDLIAAHERSLKHR